MKRRISQALAMRSTWMFLRVTQVRPWWSLLGGASPACRGLRRVARSRRSSAATAASAASRPGAPKKSMRHDLGQPLAQAREVGLELGAARVSAPAADRRLGRRRSRPRRPAARSPPAARLEQRLDLLVAQPLDEARRAERRVAALGDNLPRDPLEVLLRLLPQGST